MMTRKKISVDIPVAFKDLFTPARYKVFYGGRGGAKSWAFTKALIIKSLEKKIRILCTRELQVSISDSVHKIISDQIEAMGLSERFTILQKSIVSVNGSEFIFKGLRHNSAEIKSTEGIDICWIEEAQGVSRQNWDTLLPTIRKPNSEIWISFNPDLETDETFKRFILHPIENSIVRKVNFNENPYFPDVLRAEMEHMKKTDYQAYLNVWLGECRKYSDAQIFKDKFEVCDFETPANVKFMYGADWGFAQDPTTLIRCYIVDNKLYIDRELYGVGVDLDQLPAFFRKMPDMERSQIFADCSRPETIHFMKKKGFWINGAKKWGGSVQDGIAIMKSFDKIYIHTRCRHTADEFRFYSFKVDKLSNEILPVIEDKFNHCIDAIRYALDDKIRNTPKLRFSAR